MQGAKSYWLPFNQRLNVRAPGLLLQATSYKLQATQAAERYGTGAAVQGGAGEAARGCADAATGPRGVDRDPADRAGCLAPPEAL